MKRVKMFQQLRNKVDAWCIVDQKITIRKPQNNTLTREEISKVWLGIFEMSVEHQVEYQEAIRCINEFKGSVWVEDGKCT